MSKNGNNKNRDRTTIKVPPPLSEAEKLQAKLVAAGVNTEHVKILAFRKNPDSDGNGKVQIEVAFYLPEHEADQFIKELTIKPFHPDKDTVSIGGGEAKLVSVEEIEVPETQPPVKLWSSKERGKRSKPKSDGPDFS